MHITPGVVAAVIMSVGAIAVGSWLAVSDGSKAALSGPLTARIGCGHDQSPSGGPLAIEPNPDGFVPSRADRSDAVVPVAPGCTEQVFTVADERRFTVMTASGLTQAALSTLLSDGVQIDTAGGRHARFGDGGDSIEVVWDERSTLIILTSTELGRDELLSAIDSVGAGAASGVAIDPAFAVEVGRGLPLDMVLIGSPTRNVSYTFAGDDAASAGREVHIRAAPASVGLPELGSLTARPGRRILHVTSGTAIILPTDVEDEWFAVVVGDFGIASVAARGVDEADFLSVLADLQPLSSEEWRVLQSTVQTGGGGSQLTS